MQKIRVTFKAREEWKKLEQWGISVKTYISNNDMLAMINVYMNELFDKNREDPQNNYFRAENGLIINILSMQTNLDMIEEDVKEGDTPKIYVTMDDIFSNWKLYSDVEGAISNMGEFKRRLLKSVEQKREELRLETSLGVVLDNLYTKATAYVNKILETQLSEEELTTMRSAVTELGNAPILKELLTKLK